MFEEDALVAIDLRIVALRDARASAVRFSDAYWDADDTLAWLRMVRDELTRTGRLNKAAVAFLEASAAPMLLTPAEDIGLAGVPVMVAEPEAGHGPAVAANGDATESAGVGRGSRQAPAEPFAAA